MKSHCIARAVPLSSTRAHLTNTDNRRASRGNEQSCPQRGGLPSHRADRELGQRDRAEGRHERDVDGVAATADDYAADAATVVARVERVPFAVEIDLEPRREVHRLDGRRNVDVRDVAE